MKAYNVIEITVELKVKTISEDLYQSIIRIGFEPVRLPMIVRDAGVVVEKDSLLCIIGAIGGEVIGSAATGMIIDYFVGGHRNSNCLSIF